jgi:hypothetical protein
VPAASAGTGSFRVAAVTWTRPPAFAPVAQEPERLEGEPSNT